MCQTATPRSAACDDILFIVQDPTVQAHALKGGISGQWAAAILIFKVRKRAPQIH